MHIKYIFAKLYGNFAMATPLYKYTYIDPHRYTWGTDTNAHSQKLLKSPNKFVFVVSLAALMLPLECLT